MFCEKCGFESISHGGYCDQCGGKLTNNWLNESLVSSLPKIKGFSIRQKRLGLEIFLIAVILFFAIFLTQYNKILVRNLSSQLDKQQDQTETLNSKIAEIKTQSDENVKSLTDQLQTQKHETEQAKTQAQDAQDALNSFKKQTLSTAAGNNTFPTIDSRAMVLIICSDGNGNKQSGSGTIITADGHILTNKHVVTDDNGNMMNCAAVFNNGGNAPTLLTNIFYHLRADLPDTGFYNYYDAAVVKIDYAINTNTGSQTGLPGSFPYIRPRGGDLKQGDTLFIFGYPGASNLVFNVSRGIVSSFSSDDTFINTDAMIDHGNSGGAAITAGKDPVFKTLCLVSAG